MKNRWVSFEEKDERKKNEMMSLEIFKKGYCFDGEEKLGRAKTEKNGKTCLDGGERKGGSQVELFGISDYCKMV